MSALPTAAVMITPVDEHLAELVSRAIRQRFAGMADGLTVVAHQSIVTIRGSTRTFYERQLLLHVAQRVPGVRRIVDEMEVRPQ
jgi:osmotically-inducible protein OsmY